MCEGGALGTGRQEAPAIPRRAAALCWIAILAVDGASLAAFQRCGLSNLYGDGIAHVEAARRIFDSLTPGYAEIGRVWLPLPHLLVAPLAINDTLWRTGLAGSLISAAAFAGTAWLVFWLSCAMAGSLAPGVLALSAFLLSPNLLYAATTPLTEPLAIFWAMLTVCALFRFQQSGGSVTSAGLAAFCGALTRYDGWYLLPFAAAFVFFCRSRELKDRIGETLLFCLIAGAGPLLWLLHNAYRFHNPLDFYQGPYSAKAIYAIQVATTGFRYPTDGNLWLSARYYIEDLKLVFGVWPLILAAAGFIGWLLDRRLRSQRSAALLLLVPLLFYSQALAYGSVPIYVPTLPPHTYYNLRYGLEMAPGLAVFTAFVLPPRLAKTWRAGVVVATCGLLAIQTGAMLRHGLRALPVVQEGIRNTPCKSPAELDVIRFLRRHYEGEAVLLAAGKWPCVMPQLGIPLRNTLTEENRKYWRKLRFGASRYVGIIVVKRGDSVDELMRAYPGAFAD
ncbi:MAG TPA: hypothetical protein VKV79_00950, partial [Terriglobia bacterium]|nr:hypothetical protein [Terriglobia bacterium]